jgi:hypothetical protein
LGQKQKQKMGQKHQKITFLGHFDEMIQKWRKSAQMLQQFLGLLLESLYMTSITSLQQNMTNQPTLLMGVIRRRVNALRLSCVA